MTSLARFKQRLHGELPPKDAKFPKKELEAWVELVISVSEVEENTITEDTTQIAFEDINDAEAEIEDLEAMTKAEINLYAVEQYGIQLDRRQSKQKMITEFIQKLKESN
jgi:hypothetical protein